MALFLYHRSLIKKWCSESPPNCLLNLPTLYHISTTPSKVEASIIPCFLSGFPTPTLALPHPIFMHHPGWPFTNRVWSCHSIHPCFSIPHWIRIQNPHHGPQGPAHCSRLTCHFLPVASKHSDIFSGFLIICKLPFSLCCSLCLGHSSLHLLLAESHLPFRSQPKYHSTGTPSD